ncbi:DUF3841 domain-containing protein [Clostridium sp. ZS2-4]|uniref:DUF3841 domain-containing protein n=1 Tax=Clostridium sp. ZS2-4 TaxID=2987703 RepID=UPI00227C21B8|nr:DUF3841 domain-containing protein [Clostridium sp. ZS2-4]MCY6354200.1 DUF3841 domain-containing protein [Clostridium sp. ZS2-4]
MRLWTIQKIDAYEQFKKTKILRGNEKYVWEDFLPAYKWMIEQMKVRINEPIPEPNAYPVWAWYQWQDEKKTKPDLRYSGHLSSGEKGVRIEFEIDEKKVLLSDFELYHFVLNYWYISLNEKDDDLFDEEMEKHNLTILDLQDFSKKSKILDYFRNRAEKSWERIFDLDWYEEYVNHPKNLKSIQAVFWELHWDQVIDVKEFKAR